MTSFLFSQVLLVTPFNGVYGDIFEIIAKMRCAFPEIVEDNAGLVRIDSQKGLETIMMDDFSRLSLVVISDEVDEQFASEIFNLAMNSHRPVAHFHKAGITLVGSKEQRSELEHRAFDGTLPYEWPPIVCAYQRGENEIVVWDGAYEYWFKMPEEEEEWQIREIVRYPPNPWALAGHLVPLALLDPAIQSVIHTFSPR